MLGDVPQVHDGDAGTLCAVSIARRLCGATVADRLVQDFGGTNVFFPRVLSRHHRLSLSLGHENAVVIGMECHGVVIYVPRKATSSTAASHIIRRRAVVQLMIQERKTLDEIARGVCLSNRQVSRDIAALRAAGVLIDPDRKCGKRARR